MTARFVLDDLLAKLSVLLHRASVKACSNSHAEDLTTSCSKQQSPSRDPNVGVSVGSRVRRSYQLSSATKAPPGRQAQQAQIHILALCLPRVIQSCSSVPVVLGVHYHLGACTQASRSSGAQFSICAVAKHTRTQAAAAPVRLINQLRPEFRRLEPAG